MVISLVGGSGHGCRLMDLMDLYGSIGGKKDKGGRAQHLRSRGAPYERGGPGAPFVEGWLHVQGMEPHPYHEGKLSALNQATEDWYTDHVTLSAAKGLNGEMLRGAQHDSLDSRAR